MPQSADTMVDNGRIVYGTSLHRIQAELDLQPQDQEQAYFFGGDIRDLCNACDPKNKAAADMKERVAKILRPGETVLLPLADVRAVLASVVGRSK